MDNLFENCCHRVFTGQEKVRGKNSSSKRKVREFNFESGRFDMFKTNLGKLK